VESEHEGTDESSSLFYAPGHFSDEIATLPLVARNDNAPALNVFVFNVHFCHSGLAGIFLYDPTIQKADRKIPARRE
jgi:hypothetical protein